MQFFRKLHDIVCNIAIVHYNKPRLGMLSKERGIWKTS